MRPSALLLALLLSVGCAVPERDNPHDPSRKPSAVLVASTLAGTRSTEFELDARASEDPLDRGALRFAWELHDPDIDTDEDPDDFSLTTGTNGWLRTTLSLPPAFVGTSGEGVVSRTVRVRVIARDGAFAEEQVTLAIQNRAPVVDAGGDLYVPRDAPEVVLDACGGGAVCTTVDPDGDAAFLECTWEPLESGVTLEPVGEGWKARFVPADDRPITVRLTCGDGLASGADLVTVHFGEHLWATTVGPSRAHLVHADVRSSDRFSGGAIDFSRLQAIEPHLSGDIWTTERGSGSSLVVRRLSSSLDEIERWTLASPPNGVSIAPQADEACLAVFPNAITAGAFVRVSAGGGVVTSASVPRPRRVFTYDADTCWAVDETTVFHFESDGSLSTVLGGLTRIAAATRASDGALWIADIVTGQTSTTTLHRLGVNGSTESWPLAGRTITALEPRPDGSVWAFDLADLRLFAVGTNGSTRDTNAPPLFPVPSLSVARGMSADPLVPALWVASGPSGELVHLYDDGIAATEIARVAADEILAGASTFQTPAALPSGRVLVGLSDDTVDLLVSLPPHLRRERRVPVELLGSQATVSPEESRGTAWLLDPNSSQTTLRRLAPDGRVLATVEVNARGVAARGDGSVWTASATGPSATDLLLYSPQGAETRRIPVQGGISALALEDAAGTVCIPAYDSALDESIPARMDLDGAGLMLLAPAVPGAFGASCAVTPAGAIWLMQPDDPVSAIALYPPGATAASAVVASAFGMGFSFNPVPVGAVDPRDGGLWIVDGLRVVRLDDAGVPDLEILPGAPATAVVAVPCPYDPDPACVDVWIGVASDAQLERYDGTGTLLESRPLTSGAIIGLRRP